MGCHRPKYLMFELKKYRGVMFDDSEYWCKTWRKTNFYFPKWHEEFGKFSPKHLKVSKLKIYRGVICHDRMQNSKRNWLVVSKLTWGIWWILTRGIDNLRFNGPSLGKVNNVWAKKAQKVIFDGTED